jgi:hypothetical protein
MTEMRSEFDFIFMKMLLGKFLQERRQPGNLRIGYRGSTGFARKVEFLLARLANDEPDN